MSKYADPEKKRKAKSLANARYRETHREQRREYHRQYHLKHRQKRLESFRHRQLLLTAKLNTFCPNAGISRDQCETWAPHKHCECGWPIHPEALVCHICIAEQARLEFKTFRSDAA